MKKKYHFPNQIYLSNDCVLLSTGICFDCYIFQVYRAGKTIHSNLVDPQFKPVQINTSCRLRGTNKNVQKIESSDCKTLVFSFGLSYTSHTLGVYGRGREGGNNPCF